MTFVERLAEGLDGIDAGHSFRKLLTSPSGREEEALAVWKIKIALLENFFESGIFCRFHEHFIVRSHDVTSAVSGEELLQDFDRFRHSHSIDGYAEEGDS